MTAPSRSLPRRVYRACLRAAVRAVNRLGFTVARADDYYSPLPVVDALARSRQRWDRPSELPGLHVDLDTLEQRLRQIVGRYGAEYQALPGYKDAKKMGYGPGFTEVDALLLYCMLRDLKPARYIEVGSGLSTYYAWLASNRNAEEGSACRLTCIDPYSGDALDRLTGVERVRREVQDVEPEFFHQLSDGDILFIDSTHILRVDGDVAHLYLEIVPRVNPGVVVHSHDIHFPYNVPHPAQAYLFDAKWPRFWNEAMLLQAFLSWNPEFEIVLSAPLLRHHREEVLRDVLPDYRPTVAEDFDTHFGSLWYRRKPQ